MQSTVFPCLPPLLPLPTLFLSRPVFSWGLDRPCPRREPLPTRTGAISQPNLTLPGASYGRECLSGVDSFSIPANSTGTSAFPNPVNLGMTFDAELVEQVGSAIGDEVRNPAWAAPVSYVLFPDDVAMVGVGGWHATRA